MTDSPGLPASVIADAEATADAADERAGLRTRPVRPDEIGGVLARFEATWGVGRGPDHAIIQAIEHAGATVLVAVPLIGDDDAGAAGLRLDADVEPPVGAALASSAGTTASTCTRT